MPNSIRLSVSAILLFLTIIHVFFSFRALISNDHSLIFLQVSLKVVRVTSRWRTVTVYLLFIKLYRAIDGC